jgi:hypothetical protein
LVSSRCADAIGLADARVLAAEIMLAVARGKDPQAERKAARGAGTFEELAQRYVDDFAREHNKAWEATRYLVCRYLLPVWGKLPAAAITRADVKAMMVRVQSPSWPTRRWRQPAQYSHGACAKTLAA